ncbi:MAG: hypothetical protein WCJ55_10125 [Chloroflexales bacterium]
MRRQIASFVLIVCGIIALVGGLTMIPAPITASAQATEPSPRPTLRPTFEPDTGRKPTAVIPGRLTGTVIDLRTGAPAPGIAVAVGDQIVYSDSNGNYDVRLTSGYYQLELKPTSLQGKASQPAQRVAVGPGDTVVVHLFFTSPAPTMIAVTATSQVVMPTSTMLPVVFPSSLPNTSVIHPSVVHRPAEVASAPQSLPNTAAPTGIGSPGTWLIFGALMLGLGALIQLTPHNRRRALSSSRRRVARRAQRAISDEEVLSDLLNRDL